MKDTTFISSVHTANHSFLQNLLVAPHYRIWRHVILLVVLSFISFNQVLVYFSQVLDQLGNRVYLIAGFYLLTYLVMGYFNLFFLLPRFLRAKRYGRYVFWFLLLVGVMVGIQLIAEAYVKKDLTGIPTPVLNGAAVIEFISIYMIDVICFTGSSMTVLMKYWLTGRKEISEMQQNHLRAEVEQLKEQVSPTLLFDVLHGTALQTKEDPALASDMLVKLSQLLRYQLYDCSREKVLLRSEIAFLTHYLLLSQRCSATFTFDIQTEGDINSWMISPLLTIPFVQTAVGQLSDKDGSRPDKWAVASSGAESPHLQIYIVAGEHTLSFSCEVPVKTEMNSEELLRVRQRLDFLYPELYTLTLSAGKAELKLYTVTERRQL
ncbi:MAG: histidine kinase [Bacteroides sp.]|nr:histidine kinase [Bacteroides sp.]